MFSSRVLTSNAVGKAVLLAWFTIGFNLLEGVVAVAFGVEEHSFALLGFGLDSFIEVFSATLVLWRFKGEQGLDAELSLNKERRATFGIGILFLLLGAGTILASAFQWVAQARPSTTLPGFVIAVVSLSFMFYLWRAKVRVARELDSATMMKDARCSLACIQLSAVLFAGSLLFLLSPVLWWADSLSAIVIGGLIVHEGVDTIRATCRDDFSGGCGCG
ncbi:cation transporter [Nitrospina gracilis]|uniref:cation transporter n=1 Tax=Nitrospina gracilis TaxID=35801 RepID=UPI001F01E97F|nr:cation transporter [Nitrospina gracilis]MCF8719489.1 divalent metal cation (Fe/Co/Zn/Cd) transporter [Nitrospina gracilis Nb-211]